MAEIEKQLGEPSYKGDSKNEYWSSWLRYESGVIFCGINCQHLECSFSQKNKTLTSLYLEAVNEKTNVEPIDNLMSDLTKILGTPKISKESGSTGSYTKYSWDNGSYVIFRADDLILATIYLADDKDQKAAKICGKGIDAYITGDLWLTMQDFLDYYSCTQSSLLRSKEIEFSTIELNGDDAHCEGQFEITIPFKTGGETLLIYSFEADGNINDTTWDYNISLLDSKNQ